MAAVRGFETEEHGVMVFRPTLEEMKNFPKYIEFMETCGAHEIGIAKVCLTCHESNGSKRFVQVIPPPEYVPRKNYDGMNISIAHPIKQVVTGGNGLHRQKSCLLNS